MTLLHEGQASIQRSREAAQQNAEANLMAQDLRTTAGSLVDTYGAPNQNEKRGKSRAIALVVGVIALPLYATTTGSRTPADVIDTYPREVKCQIPVNSGEPVGVSITAFDYRPGKVKSSKSYISVRVDGLDEYLLLYDREKVPAEFSQQLGEGWRRKWGVVRDNGPYGFRNISVEDAKKYKEVIEMVKEQFEPSISPQGSNS